MLIKQKTIKVVQTMRKHIEEILFKENILDVLYQAGYSEADVKNIINNITNQVTILYYNAPRNKVLLQTV